MEKVKCCFFWCSMIILGRCSQAFYFSFLAKKIVAKFLQIQMLYIIYNKHREFVILPRAILKELTLSAVFFAHI